MNLQENIEGFASLVGVPDTKKITANLYTDGSYSCEKNEAGYGAFLQFKDQFYSWSGALKSSNISSRYEGEAMWQGVSLARSVGITAMNIYIDCRNLYTELIQRKTQWAKDFCELLDQCTIYLIYSHVGIYGNEFADDLSRMYLDGIPEQGFHLRANDHRFFKVQRVANSFAELINRIKKSKKTFAPPPDIKPENKTIKADKKPSLKPTNNTAKQSTQLSSNNPKSSKIKAKAAEYVTLKHPATKQAYKIKRTLYEAIRNQRLMDIEKEGVKRKTVSDGYIAQEAYRRECAREKSKKKKTA